jgi:hypothetical protein
MSIRKMSARMLTMSGQKILSKNKKVTGKILLTSKYTYKAIEISMVLA